MRLFLESSLNLVHNCGFQDVLRAYNASRVPRTTYVADASWRAGEVYQGLGPSGTTDDDLRRDLDRQWDAVWHHDSQAEVAKIVDNLVGEGVFVKDN